MAWKKEEAELMAHSYAIVGGGMAGLAAAQVLLTEDTTADVTIYEALDRIGGRAYTQEFGTTAMDWGCEALEAGDKAPTQVLTQVDGVTELKYADSNNDDALGDQYEPQDNATALFFDIVGGSKTDLTGNVGSSKAPQIAAIKANQAAVEANPSGPATDSVISGVNLEFGNADQVAMRMNILSQQELFGEGCVPGMASLRDQVRSESLQAEFGQTGSAVYFKEGLGTVIGKWAQDDILTKFKKNVTLKLSSRVSSIQNKDNGSSAKVAVTVADDDPVDFDAALVTVPSNVIASGTLSLPDLPLAAMRAFADCPLGTYCKMVLTNVANVSRPAANRRLYATLQHFGDVLHIGQSADGALCYAHAANYLGEFLSHDAARAELWFKAILNGLNGGTLDFSKSEFHAAPWYQAPANGGTFGGAYSYAKAGKDQSRLMLASLNVGQIFFAGEVCSPIWYGQLAGAMESGQRMARRMISALGS